MITEYNGIPLAPDSSLQTSRGGLFDEYTRETDKHTSWVKEFVADMFVEWWVNQELLRHDSILERARTGSDYEPHMKINGGRIAYP